MSLHAADPCAVAAALLASIACGPVVVTPGAEGDGTTQDAPSSDGDDDDDEHGDGDPPVDDDGPHDPSEPMFPDLPSDPSTTDGDETGPPPEGECPPFDPTRVYLHGTLSEGLSYVDAIADPFTPTEFCVGFGDNSHTFRVHPTDGRAAIVQRTEPAGVMAFTPDVWTWNGSYVEYPEDPHGNDEMLLPSPCNDGFTGLAYLRLHPIDGRPYSSCSGVWFDPDGAPVLASPSGNVVAVLPDGRVATHEPQGFFLLGPEEIPDAPLELPREAIVVAGRVHGDGMWLVAAAYPQLYRWSLVDDVIVEEGEYSDAGLGNANVDIYNGAIDSDGDFFHIVQSLGGGFYDAIARRRLAPEASEIIYTEEGLPEGQSVKIHGVGELFTGP